MSAPQTPEQEFDSWYWKYFNATAIPGPWSDMKITWLERDRRAREREAEQIKFASMLKEKNKRLQTEVLGFEAENEQLRQRFAVAESMLRKAAGDRDGFIQNGYGGSCPECGKSRNEGHVYNCQFAALLKLPATKEPSQSWEAREHEARQKSATQEPSATTHFATIAGTDLIPPQPCDCNAEPTTAALIAEGRAIESQMTPGPWDVSEICGQTFRDRIGIVWLRNHIGEILKRLEEQEAAAAAKHESLFKIVTAIHLLHWTGEDLCSKDCSKSPCVEAWKALRGPAGRLLLDRLAAQEQTIRQQQARIAELETVYWAMLKLSHSKEQTIRQQQARIAELEGRK